MNTVKEYIMLVMMFSSDGSPTDKSVIEGFRGLEACQIAAKDLTGDRTTTATDRVFTSPTGRVTAVCSSKGMEALRTTR